MACLVTGGTGYIGSYVVRDLLDAGKDVVSLQRSGVTQVALDVIGKEKIGRVRIVSGDISNTLFLFDLIRQYGIDLIIHIAYVMPPTSELEPAYALRFNCVGMNNLLEAVRLFGLKKLIWISAGMALGSVSESYKKPVGDDNAIYRPYTMYGATKALNEFMARLYFDKFAVDSLGFRIQRAYGVGRWHGAAWPFANFLRCSALNIPTTMEDWSFTIGHVYIEDLSALIVRMCDAPTTKTRVFNIIEGEYTNRQIVETIRKINPGAQITLTKPEPGVAKKLVLPCVDSKGVRAELGWQPKYSLEDGLRACLNYIRRKEGMPLL